jgi:thioredoxin 1
MIEITGRDFDDEVLKSELPVLACFSTSPCGACFALCLVTEDLTEEYEGRIKFVKIDVEKEHDLAARYNIIPLPALLLFQHGKPVKKLGGFQSKAYLKKSLTALIAENEHSP